MNTEAPAKPIWILRPGGEPEELTVDQIMELHHAGQLPKGTQYHRGGKWHALEQVTTARLPAQSGGPRPKATAAFENPPLMNVWYGLVALDACGVFAGIVMTANHPDNEGPGLIVIASCLVGGVVCVTVAHIVGYLAKIAHYSARK